MSSLVLMCFLCSVVRNTNLLREHQICEDIPVGYALVFVSLSGIGLFFTLLVMVANLSILSNITHQ